MTELYEQVVFDITPKELRELGEARDPKRLKKYDGVEGLAKRLCTDLVSGLSADEATSGFAVREKVFGRNVFPEPPKKPFWKFFWEAITDRMLILLSVFAVLSIILESIFPPEGRESIGWIEGVAIIVAVLIVSFVGSINNYSKEIKFQALNSVKNDRTIKVIRANAQATVSINDIQAGDVVQLDTGDYIPADGVFIDGHGLAIDEAAMTGESESVKKNPNAPYLISGCMVSDGSGRMLVTGIGMNSEWGIVKSAMATEDSPTPLQEHLDGMVVTISYIGIIAAVATFIVLIIHFAVDQAALGSAYRAQNLTEIIHIFLQALSLVVAVVPEGLPLAVTITLAFSMGSMLKDKNLVRHLSACETMGGATMICSDKTGTLTENRMTVVQMWACGDFISSALDDSLPKLETEFVKLLCTSISVNSSAFLKEHKTSGDTEFVGNKTECALLVLAKKLGYKYKKIRKRETVIHILPFSSAKKRMSTIIKSRSDEKTGVLHVKGASEIVLGLCTRYIDKGKISKMDNGRLAELQASIESMASSGLRTLCLAYRNLPETEVVALEKETSLKDSVGGLGASDASSLKASSTLPSSSSGKSEAGSVEADIDQDLTLVAIVGIEDPVRKEVPPAIEVCKKAGIKVRMVTGDNKLTAAKIARECGIIERDDDVVIEGPDFRKLTDKELDALLPRLAVVARSSPTDKHRLVMRLKALKEVVAVTGDGTNDGPALKAADVGLAMGIAGTEIAKEASDIIIMDDNFASIVKSVLWGRGVRANIQKFLQFQLELNIVAVMIVFISAIVGQGEPLRPLQLLWLNLVADSLAALALATEKPEPEVLNDKPAGRTDRLITPIMSRNLFFYSLYQLIICLLIQYTAHWVLPLNEDGINTKKDASIRYTMVFNVFVFFQVFNMINSHRVDNRINVFHNVFNNWVFIAIVVGISALQAIIVEFGGVAFDVTPLTWWQWLFCIGVAFTILPFGALMRALVPVPTWSWLKHTNSIPWVDYNPRKRRRQSGLEDLATDDDDSMDDSEESSYTKGKVFGNIYSAPEALEIPSISSTIASLAFRGRTASSRGLLNISNRRLGDHAKQLKRGGSATELIDVKIEPPAESELERRRPLRLVDSETQTPARWDLVSKDSATETDDSTDVANPDAATAAKPAADAAKLDATAVPPSETPAQSAETAPLTGGKAEEPESPAEAQL
eukprot:TRINITY_DN6997_c0_g1_i2.p1 TRINITY_DN6997_c0_g1~~TRINITY_DN6997_c0_g1_i2.p1  ORF type:complete len:1194 (-),score=489.40 TRINITY_DN6997_c0_g1_i2:187-3768(-)